MDWLQAARECCPREWAIGAGALRNLVWDRLTGRCNPPVDVDVAYFGGAGESEVEGCLRNRLPPVPWQARDHWSTRRPFPPPASGEAHHRALARRDRRRRV